MQRRDGACRMIDRLQDLDSAGLKDAEVRGLLCRVAALDDDRNSVAGGEG